MPAPPYRMWEILERARTGPFCEDEPFIMERFMPELKEVIGKYGIEYDAATPIPGDDGLADALWQAGLEFFLKVGVLCVDTHRIITFDEREVKEALYLTPGEYMVGSGKDGRWLKRREVEDANPPFVIFSPDISCDEELFSPMCIAYLKEPLADGFCAPILEESMGLKIKAKTPTELAGSIEHAMSLRQAAKLVGRPGIFLVAAGTAESDVGQISISHSDWGVRTTDSRLVGGLTELKIDNALLNKAAHYQQFGCFTGSLTGPIYGGYAGRAEGTAILQVAYHLMGLLVHQAHYQMNFPFHIHYTCGTTRELLWVASASHQAVARNSKLISVSNGFLNAGPATEMVLYEAAAHALASTVSGANLWEAAPARNKHKNRATPMEARMAAEVGHACARMRLSREGANDLVLKLLAKYEDRIADAPLGSEFRECYDVAKAVPTQEYLDLYARVREDLAGMGFEFPY
ncbi:MAG: monomethylamine:corrinoid methyltransferase [Anaerolineae bacterium]